MKYRIAQNNTNHDIKHNTQYMKGYIAKYSKIQQNTAKYGKIQ